MALDLSQDAQNWVSLSREKNSTSFSGTLSRGEEPSEKPLRA